MIEESYASVLSRLMYLKASGAEFLDDKKELKCTKEAFFADLSWMWGERQTAGCVPGHVLTARLWSTHNCAAQMNVHVRLKVHL